MANGSAKVTGFPGASQVPTVGQRMCPFLSQAVVAPAGQPGQITVQCAGSACRLWEWCSGAKVDHLLMAMTEIAKALLADAVKK